MAMLPKNRPRPKRGHGWILWTLLVIALVAALAVIGWRLRYQQIRSENQTQAAELLESAEKLIAADQNDEAHAVAQKALALVPDNLHGLEIMQRIITKRELARQKQSAAAVTALAQAEKLAATDITAAIAAYGKIRLGPSFPPDAKTTAAERAKALQGPVCSLRMPDNWPADAALTIDDSKQDSEKPLISGITPGKHKIGITRYDFRPPPAIELDFRGTDPLPLPAIKWQPVGTKVSITSIPPGAAVWRDGKATGKATPCTLLDIDDGPIELILKLPEYADTPVKGEVKDRAPLKLAARLSPAPRLPRDGKTAGERREINLTSEIRVPFRWCPAGSFKMGGPAPNEGPVREVTLSKGFWIAETEFTQKQWDEVAGEFADVHIVSESKGNPRPALGPQRPMVLIAWDKLCGGETRRGGLLGKINAYLAAGKSPWLADLPTEAQWEYACRAGTTGPFATASDDAAAADNLAWHAGNGGAATHDAATKQANPWGLHDMHGNVYEWCRDRFLPTYKKAANLDPTGPTASGWDRSIRGGSFSSPAAACRSASRSGADETKPQPLVGFRLVLHLPEAAPKATPPPPKKATAKPKPKPKTPPKPKPKTPPKKKPKK
jgi:formylglycine-generating enzyme required for sulfatase activity